MSDFDGTKFSSFFFLPLFSFFPFFCAVLWCLLFFSFFLFPFSSWPWVFINKGYKIWLSVYVWVFDDFYDFSHYWGANV